MRNDNEQMRSETNAKIAAGHAERPSPWDHCGIEEKLERVRNELRQLRYVWPRLSNFDQRLDQLTDHAHDAQGRIMTPLRHHGYGVMGVAQEAGSSFDPLA